MRHINEQVVAHLVWLHALSQPFEDRAEQGIEKIECRFVIPGELILMCEQLGVEEQACDQHIDEKRQ